MKLSIHKPQAVDRLFNGWRTSFEDNISKIVATTVKLLEDFERHFGLRKRARKSTDRDTMVATVSAIVCDLMHRVLTSENGAGRVAVSLDTSIKKNRYRTPTDNKQFAYLIHTLSKPGMGILEIDEAGEWMSHRRTAVKAGPHLLRLMASAEQPPRVTDFEVDYRQEIVILKKAKEVLDRESATDRSRWVDYADTSLTDRYRAEMKQINYWLAGQPITYRGGKLIDVTDRFLRRYFNNESFEDGGRLFGGFWMNLKKRQRQLIRIDGAPVVTLDYDTMIARLAYAQVGLPLPVGDAYDIPGLRREDRAGIKRVFSSMLFARKPLQSWPRFVRQEFGDDFPKLAEVVNAIRSHHSALDELWFTGVGHKMMFTESQVLVKALLDLIGLQLVALPIHDALVCREDDADEVEDVMLQAFTSVTGQTATVSVDSTAGHRK